MGFTDTLIFHCWCTALLFSPAAVGLTLIAPNPATKREELVYGLVLFGHVLHLLGPSGGLTSSI
jgi:hypothetical protein